MTRTLSIALVAGLAASANAAPPALDYVPEGAVLVAAVDDVGALGAQLQSLLERLGMAEAAGNLQMATVGISGMGLKPDGSAALVLMSADFEAMEQTGQHPVALIAEVADYEGMIESLGGDSASPVAEFTFQGQDLMARRLADGWAVIGPDREVLESVDGDGGGAIAEWSGAVGRDVSESSNLVIMADMQALRPMLQESLEEMQDRMAEAAAMGGAPGDMGGEFARGLMEQVLDNTRVGVLGMHIDDSGVAIDLAAQFTEDSDLAGYFDQEGDAGSLTARLPQVPVLLAAAFDASHPAIRELLSALGELRAEVMPDAPPSQMLTLLENSDGGAFVFGDTPALLGGGVFSNTAMFLASDDPAQITEANEEALAAVDGLEQQGVTTHTSYTRNAQEVAGAAVDSWSVAMEFDPDAPMAGQVSTAFMFIFGPTGGPSGLTAEVDSGVVGTLSQNRRLLEKAITAARDGDGLLETEEMAEAADNLAGGHIAELYIGVGKILSTAASAMGMVGRELDVTIPEDLGVVPVAVGSNGGGLRVRTFLPTDVIVTISELQAYFQELQGGMNPMGNDEWEEDEAEDEGF